MPTRAWIPNGLTLANLGCGSAAILLCLTQGSSGAGMVALLMLIAMLCDFLDGFAARALKVSGPLGKELDSLADMVTFGLLPGMLCYRMIEAGVERMASARPMDDMPGWHALLPYIGLVIPLLSALRLAKFNVDTRQSDKFLGLATPANALLWLSLFLIHSWDQPLNYLSLPWGPHWTLHVDGHWTWHWVGWLVHPYVLPVLAVLLAGLLVTEIPLIAFKFKGMAWGKNWPKYMLLVVCAAVIAVFTFRAGPFVLLAYFLFSFIDHRRKSVG